MNLNQTIVGQFKNPHGILGMLAGWIMAHRQSNRGRNVWMVDLLDIRPEDRVFEFGCGPGVALEACAEAAHKGYVLGLDHSKTMIEQARARNVEAISQGRLVLRLGALEDMAVGQQSFDKIASANVVQFLPDRAAAFRRLFSLLGPGGRCASTYMPRGKNPSREGALKMARDVERHMGAAGFVNIRTEELPMDPVPAISVIGERP
ncbi:MAG: methyltransferase domain-containing protein [Proteobacteria bacterium]|nr:methyltransferase domain-containing protein [Pseudomonadota bacterium]